MIQTGHKPYILQYDYSLDYDANDEEWNNIENCLKCIMQYFINAKILEELQDLIDESAIDGV